MHIKNVIQPCFSDDISCEINDNIKTRDETDNKFKWNIEAMYSDISQWEKDLNEALSESETFIRFKGNLGSSAKNLLEALQMRNSIWQKIEKVYVYARMKRDEDNSNQMYQSLCDKAQATLSKISQNMSFFTPELIQYNLDDILKFLDELEPLREFDFMIRVMFREKPHILSLDEEKIIASYGELMSATNNIFTMLNNADINFSPIIDKNGNKLTLTHGNYISFLKNPDKEIRKQAYESVYSKYKELINTIATTYNYNTKTDVVAAKLRKYSSARNMSMSSDNIDESVYDNLVDEITNYLPALHKYMRLRKDILKLDTLNMWDVYMPLFEPSKNATSIDARDIPFEKSVEIMQKALKPLGDNYISEFTKGISDGWVDIYENRGKTSGAYSFGSYDSMPYILMNYTNTLNDLFTLVHEMGHSMHSFYTRKTQPYTYGDHSIFTAEVASTVNENLLIKYLIDKETDLEMKKYLINYHLEEFRTTVFRQTMFAEFEKWTHEQVEQGVPLTAKGMCEYYLELNKKYFGEAVEMDDFIQYEWSRIPHFYNAFYVYKYATGYCAAEAISNNILENGADNYLKFLSTGSSNDPIELLKIAGVDMSSKEPIKQALNVFSSLVEELEKMCK